jgi:hypothetical protein
MLYQLSYASALKPSKDSRRGTRIARGWSQISSTSVASGVEKHFPRYLQDTTIPFVLYRLAYKSRNFASAPLSTPFRARNFLQASFRFAVVPAPSNATIAVRCPIAKV